MPIQLGVFPNHLEFFKDLYRFYDLNKPIAFSLMATFFIIRATMLVASGSSAREFGELFRDLLFTTIVLVGFTSFLQGIGHIPDFLIQQLGSHNEIKVQPEEGWAASFKDTLLLVIDLLVMAVTLLVGLVYVILIGISCMLGPFLVLISIMGRQTWLLKSIITALVLTSLWPVLWYLMNFFMSFVMKDSSWLVGSSIFIVGTVAKIGIPIALIKMLGQISGANQAASNTKAFLNQTSSQTQRAAQGALAATSFLGGGHYIASINKSLGASREILSSNVSSLAGQVVPSVEKVGAGTFRMVGRALSGITPKPLKEQMGSVAKKAMNVSSKITNGLQGHNYEAFSLGSPVPSSRQTLSAKQKWSSPQPQSANVARGSEYGSRSEQWSKRTHSSTRGQISGPLSSAHSKPNPKGSGWKKNRFQQ